jgi:hypothetical protein
MLDVNEQSLEVINRFTNAIEKIDSINKQLVKVLIVSVVAFCLTLITIVGMYFFADYTYPQITQTQSDSSSSKATINIRQGGTE